MSIEYSKVKSVAKQVETKGPALDQVVLQTMGTISSIVGSTLGPGGQPVLIERYEHNMPAMVTKDGVTVFRSVGFDNALAHCIMELARDASIRTASQAGDGTTTATILSEAIYRFMREFCKRNPRMSPQKVVRHLERTFRDHIEPEITRLSRRAHLEDPEGLRMLHAVATVSANGDTELADAVIECFKNTGDEGNVTIVESSGSGPPQVEQIDGFAIGMGYEESCGKFGAAFLNEPGTQRVVMEKPVFLLYHGRITEIQTIKLLMETVGHAWINEGYNHNVVVCAIGFSDTVLANLAANAAAEGSINVFPLVVPQSIQTNGQLQFLRDLQAITGARILDPLSAPVEQATLKDLEPGVDSFEASRFRSSVIGYADDALLTIRIDELKQQLASPESELDAILLRERIAKLSGGIAKLRVIGSSNGEQKEKRDRAEDAVCAVRGAIKYGCLPGGAWTLLKLCHTMPRDQIIDGILRRAFLVPFERLVTNSGLEPETEGIAILDRIVSGIADDCPVVWDFLNEVHCDPYVGGILDSTPAVLEAIRTSISVAAQLGTLGGIVAFKRDAELERTEARATSQWLRDANVNPADERP